MKKLTLNKRTLESHPRPKSSAYRKRQPDRHTSELRQGEIELSRALKRYLGLLLKHGVLVQMQLTLPANASSEVERRIIGQFAGAGFVAHPIGGSDLLLAGEPCAALALADCAAATGVLSNRLQAYLSEVFDAETPRPTWLDERTLRRFERLVAHISLVDLPQPTAFAQAGLDISRIYSSRRSR